MILGTPSDVEKEVPRVDVAVDHREGRACLVVHGVSVLERVGDARPEEREDLVRERDASLPARVSHSEERLAPEELHGQKEAALVRAELEDPHDVGMDEARGDARFVEKHRHELVVSAVLRPDDLEGHQVVRRIGRAPEVDMRHAATGDGREHLVTAERVEGELSFRRRHRLVTYHRGRAGVPPLAPAWNVR